jgi:DNA-binding beta-propeller fold protein YncE
METLMQTSGKERGSKMGLQYIWQSASQLLGGLVILGLAGGATARLLYFAEPAAQAVSAPDTGPAFQGRVAALSDLDQAASGYANGTLFLLPGQSDRLSIIDGNDVTSVPVSNSVIGWVTTHRRSPDGRFIYVGEIRGQAPAGTKQIKQPYANFPAGSLVTVIDTSAREPVVVARLAAGKNPGPLDVNAAGSLLAVGTDEPNAPIRMWNLENGVPVGAPIDVKIDLPESNRRGARALRFHPSGDFLAVNLSDKAVGFFKITRDTQGRVTGLAPHGDLIRQTGPSVALSEVEFTPDGRFVLVPDVNWGNQTPREVLTNKPGRIISIRFDASAAASHTIVNAVEVGRSPEGMEISPDGRFAVAVNMERSYLPNNPAIRMIAGGGDAGSLSLITIDPGTGVLTAKPPVRLAAVLPEDAIFDVTSRNLAVTIFERPGDGARERGFVDFWRITGDGANAQLTPTSRSVALPRGVHDLELLPPIGTTFPKAQ